MRIALLTYATKPRGSVIHTLELATALTALGHGVTVFALDKDGAGIDYPLPCSLCLVPAAPAPPDLDQLIHQRIQEFVSFFETHLGQAIPAFDLYHAQDCIGANALLHLRQGGQIPHFVRTVHHVEDFQSPYLQACQERSIRQPDLVLCVSQGWQAVLQRDYGIMAPRVLNGVDLQRFSPQPSGQEADLQTRYGWTGWPRYLTVGGIEPRKNSLNLLRAFAQVRATYPQAQLAIAGGATLFDYQSYREQFFTLAQSLGLEPGADLILPGVIPAADLPVLYRCAQGFCFPSQREGWGLVVLEAIASGLPVVLSRQPPFTEFLGPDQAIWVEAADPASIAQGMVAAIAPGAGQRVQSSQAILDQYTWQRSAQHHLDHYQALLSVQGSPVLS